MNANEARVQALGDLLRQRGERLATAESCTGGLIAAACTDIAGSSDWFERGFVTYSNEAKSQQLGVDPSLVTTRGAVSEEVVRAMALGALRHSLAQWTVAVTGIAGPGGGTPSKPVGTVWLAVARGAPSLAVRVQRLQLAGDRAAVRRQTVERALEAVLEWVREPGPC